jgi:uncharacterized sulfatase
MQAVVRPARTLPFQLDHAADPKYLNIKVENRMKSAVRLCRGALLYVVVLFLHSPVLAASGIKPPRPNMVVIIADDLGYGDLSSYGHPSIMTPAIDRLAAEGQRWTNFYAGAPVCSPSRGALMTGKLPVRSGLYGVRNVVFWPDAKGEVPPADRTLAEALKRSGYDTAMVGKWHLGDKAYALPTRKGFDFWLGTPYSNDQDWWIAQAPNGDRAQHELALKFQRAVSDPNRKPLDWNTSLIRSTRLSSGYVDAVIERPANQEMFTQRYTEQAVSFIKAHAKDRRPFFLYLAYNAPHIPTFSSQSFKGRSLAGSYGDAVEEIDWSVREIRNVLEDVGLAKDTVLIFSSDNGVDRAQIGGSGSAGLLRGRKGTTFEGGMRVPGVFWWPGHIKPAVVHGIGGLTDIYATLLSLAGVVEVESDIDSIDLTPALAGKPSPRQTLEYFGITGQLLGYRKGAWKVSFTEDGRTVSNKHELYNLDQDPSESIDISHLYPEILESLTSEAKSRAAAIPHAEPIFDQE